MIKNYELTYLTNPQLEETEAKNLHQRLIFSIQERNGLLIKEKIPNKRKLAYPIKKQEQAYLGVINFQLASEKINDLEESLKKESNILRYLIVTLPSISKTKTPLPTLKDLSIKTTKEKIDLKEIDKKLDEILGFHSEKRSNNDL